jgi:hypothetical protein
MIFRPPFNRGLDLEWFHQLHWNKGNHRPRERVAKAETGRVKVGDESSQLQSQMEDINSDHEPLA